MASLSQQLLPLVKQHSHIAVAYSAGRDSAAMLHALAMASKNNPLLRVTAIHVHHGLQEVATQWVAFAKNSIAALVLDGCAVSLDVQYVTIPQDTGLSTEAVARTLRYEVLERSAKEAGATVVVLGHHRKDQAETFLLQALRGAGVAGLAGMPAVIERKGLAWVRPWLQMPRESIDVYVHEHQVPFVDDPTNALPLYARNKTRLDVLPVLAAQFPDAEVALVQSAQWCAEASDALSYMAAQDLLLLEKDDSLNLADTKTWPVWRKKNVIRHWYLHATGQHLSSSALERVMQSNPAVGQMTSVPSRCAPGLVLQRGRLSVEDTSRSQSAGPWPDRVITFSSPDNTVDVPERNGHWQLIPGEYGVTLPMTVTVGRRRPGLQFKKGSNQPARAIKNQFQAAGIGPAERDGPYMYAGEDLVWAPGLGLDARVTQGPGWIPVWVPGPAPRVDTPDSAMTYAYQTAC